MIQFKYKTFKKMKEDRTYRHCSIGRSKNRMSFSNNFLGKAPFKTEKVTGEGVETSFSVGETQRRITSSDRPDSIAKYTTEIRGFIISHCVEDICWSRPD